MELTLVSNFKKNIMKINYIKQLLLLSLVVLTTGCNDAEFLDTPPETFLT
ncbi:hypothetical protein JCM19274_2891 [Algibacter lectus]|uniref:Uncharacterized protein n=1 Tax=Algibacter lectus TaxID=221126 RepID=A0A090X6U8_9FLAO|nr:hypothetical protein JCM19274_2891 [Algibacter lectus]